MILFSKIKKFIKQNPFQTVILVAMLGYFGVYAYTGICPLQLAGERISSGHGELSTEAASFNLFEVALDLELVDGTVINTADFQGKITVINYWATWCGPCVREIPSFNRIYNEQSDRVQFVGISLDSHVDAVTRFFKRTPIDYPVSHADMRFSQLTGPIRSIPTTLFFDENGKYAGKVVGALSEKSLERKLKSL